MKKRIIFSTAITAATAGLCLALYRKETKINPYDIVIDKIPEKADDALRIMSFNLRCKDDKAGSVENRSKIVAAIIRQYSPDSVGVQEATGQWMNILEKALGDKYACVATPRDSSGYKSERNAVFYLKDKYNLIDSGTIWLSETPEVVNSKSFGSSCNRIATWAVLENKSDGAKYAHLNTHLDHLYENARLGQSDVLINKFNELEQKTKVVCTGDFNTDTASEVYRKMTSMSDDSRVSAVNSDNGMTFHDYGKFTDNFDGAIDYIYVTKGTKVYTHKIIRNTFKGMFPSDHYPIVADMDLTE